MSIKKILIQSLINIFNVRLFNVFLHKIYRFICGNSVQCILPTIAKVGADRSVQKYPKTFFKNRSQIFFGFKNFSD